MNDSSSNSPIDGIVQQDSDPNRAKKKSISMHEDVPVWHDCCCCEAEPYWVAVAEELGIDLDAGWDRK